MNDRHFTAPVDEISGTVEGVSAGGVTLKEYPGRRFQFSSVCLSTADMSARVLGEHNNMTRSLRPAEHKTLAYASKKTGLSCQARSGLRHQTATRYFRLAISGLMPILAPRRGWTNSLKRSGYMHVP